MRECGGREGESGEWNSCHCAPRPHGVPGRHLQQYNKTYGSLNPIIRYNLPGWLQWKEAGLISCCGMWQRGMDLMKKTGKPFPDCCTELQVKCKMIKAVPLLGEDGPESRSLNSWRLSVNSVSCQGWGCV